jgi:hypothetical protein
MRRPTDDQPTRICAAPSIDESVLSRDDGRREEAGSDHSDLHFGPGVSLPGLQNIERSYSFAPEETLSI